MVAVAVVVVDGVSVCPPRCGSDGGEVAGDGVGMAVGSGEVAGDDVVVAGVMRRVRLELVPPQLNCHAPDGGMRESVAWVVNPKAWHCPSTSKA